MAVRGSVTRASAGAKSKSRARIGFGSVRFYIVLILVAVALHFIGTVVSYIPIVEPDPPQDVANEYRKKQIDIWAEMNKLLIALATLAIGAIGGFLLKGNPAAPLPARQARRAAAGWIFCALSLYFGYLSYHEATLMLSLGTFNSNSPRLWWPTRAQFWTFIFSVVLFADLVYGSTHTRRQSGNQPREDG
jgi:hypothetical protein